MNDESRSVAGVSDLKLELESLVAEFERHSQELPPHEEALRAWRQQALSIGRRLRESDVSGKNKLLLKLSKFRMRLRTTHTARKAYEDQRGHLVPSFNEDNAWFAAPAELGRNRRAPLAQAIRDICTTDAARIPDWSTARRPEQPHASDEIAETDETPASVVREAVASKIELTAVPDRKPDFRERRKINSVAVPANQHSTRQDPIVAVVGRLGRAGSFDEARAVAINWLRKKGFKLPKTPADNFELDGSARGSHAIAVGLAKIWAMQADTVDSAVQGRRWRVEMVLVDADPTPAVSVMLSAISQADQPPPPPSVPALVSQLIDRIGLVNTEAAEALSAEPIEVNGPDSLQRLLRSLQSPRRHMPAIVLSTYLKDDHSAHLLDPSGLSKRLRGIAKVYVLTREMSWALTDALSKRFAVAGASVRLFRSGFTPEDDPMRHPLWGPDVLKAQNLDLKGLSGLLEREAAVASLRALEQDDVIPAFDRVRGDVLRRQIEQARRQAAQAPQGHIDNAEKITALQTALNDESKLRSMFEDDNVAQRQEIQRLREELDRVEEERTAWRSREYHFQARIDELKQRLREINVEEVVELPETWEHLEQWCDRHLSDRVVVTPKAVRAARDSEFQNIRFCYEVLAFLADTYVPSRRGILEGGLARLEEEKHRLGIDVSPVGQAAVMRRSKETYSADYKGKRVNLNMHVQGDSDRDPRKGFRLYFHWDDADQCVVVGSFPGHLDNGMT